MIEKQSENYPMTSTLNLCKGTRRGSEFQRRFLVWGARAKASLGVSGPVWAARANSGHVCASPNAQGQSGQAWGQSGRAGANNLGVLLVSLDVLLDVLETSQNV